MKVSKFHTWVVLGIILLVAEAGEYKKYPEDATNILIQLPG